MKLRSFRVRNFRNVIDSGDVQINPQVTCLVGKNEAGKSALLEALYLFNPAYDEAFEVEEQYPRWRVVRDRRDGDLSDSTPITVTLTLESSDHAAVNDVLGPGVLRGESMTVKRKYSGDTVWEIAHSESAAIKALIEAFPNAVEPHVNPAYSRAA